MAFADTGILDDFNRANEGPPPSSNWTQWNALNQLTVASNEALNEPSDAEVVANYWNVETFGPHAEAFITISNPNGNAFSGYSVFARLQTGDVTDGYAVIWEGSDEDNINLQRIDNGLFTALGSSFSGQVVDAGDKIGLECQDDKIRAYKDEGGGWGQVGVDRTDSTYSAAGFIAMRNRQGGTTESGFDDFGGGTVAAAENIKVKFPRKAVQEIF